MVFPFGLEAMPPLPGPKDADLFFANRGLEPIYAPARVIEVFHALSSALPQARLVVANDGSLRSAMQAQVDSLGLAQRVRFVGRLNSSEQSQYYARARWYVSLPQSDSVSVSVLEAMAHGCVPILSDLPANRELVRDGDNGLILADGATLDLGALQRCAARADRIAVHNRAWVQEHALFAPCVQAFAARLAALHSAP
jgi:glycosyltransferase involved in cell wall biosynthesis